VTVAVHAVQSCVQQGQLPGWFSAVPSQLVTYRYPPSPTLQGEVVVTVAARGAAYSSASSPNALPGPYVFTFLGVRSPGRVTNTSQVPISSTKNSWASVAPCARRQQQAWTAQAAGDELTGREGVSAASHHAQLRVYAVRQAVA
jgi:hypothetical protein